MAGEREAGLQIGKQGFNIPVSADGILDGHIREPMQFFQRKPVILQRTQHQPAAFGPEVTREIMHERIEPPRHEDAKINSHGRA